MRPRHTLSSEKFAKRRKKLFIWKLVAGVCVIVALVVGFFWLTTINAFQVTDIVVSGNQVTSTAEIVTIANSYLDQHELRFIPERDTFFLPKVAIEQAVKAKSVRINSVVVTRDGLHGITITLDEKDPAYLWCGASQQSFLNAVEMLAAMATSTATSTSGAASGCYFMDSKSYIFDKVSTSTSSSSDLFKFYGTLGDAATTTTALSTPLGSYYASSTEFDYMNQFVTSLQADSASLHLTPVAVWKKNDDEAEVLTSNGPLLYISDEEDIPTTLKDLGAFLTNLSTLSSTSTKSTLTLGSIDYIDLRYDSKIYYMPKAGK